VRGLGPNGVDLRGTRSHRNDLLAGRVNEIVIDFADPGSIRIDFMAKVPGPEMSLGPTGTQGTGDLIRGIGEQSANH
jgi:hypothetical protein